MAGQPWQLQLVKKSLKKKEKLKFLDRFLSARPEDISLDLGCAQGILSYYLRLKGGSWISADLDLLNCQTSLQLLGTNVIQIGRGHLPFQNGRFDRIVSLDFLEHLEDDLGCLKEIHRLLKPGGELVLAVPRTGRGFLLHKLRPLLGITLESYGHKRTGYSLKSLGEKLTQAGFAPFRHKSFSRFFSEFFELLLNLSYIQFFRPPLSQGLRDGHIRPTTEDEFKSKRKAFRLYAFVHPLIWLVTRLDLLLFFQRGYGLLIWAKKR